MSSEPESFRLPGPEIPDVEVDENGVFRSLRGDVEVCETSRARMASGGRMASRSEHVWRKQGEKGSNESHRSEHA